MKLKLNVIDQEFGPIREHILESLQINLAYIFRSRKVRREREEEEKMLEEIKQKSKLRKEKH